MPNPSSIDRVVVVEAPGRLSHAKDLVVGLGPGQELGSARSGSGRTDWSRWRDRRRWLSCSEARRASPARSLSDHHGGAEPGWARRRQGGGVRRSLPAVLAPDRTSDRKRITRPSVSAGHAAYCGPRRRRTDLAEPHRPALCVRGHLPYMNTVLDSERCLPYGWVARQVNVVHAARTTFAPRRKAAVTANTRPPRARTAVAPTHEGGEATEDARARFAAWSPTRPPPWGTHNGRRPSPREQCSEPVFRAPGGCP
jgi:hypothetical protein